MLALAENLLSRDWTGPYIFKVVSLLGVEVGWSSRRHGVDSLDSFLVVLNYAQESKYL
jgi:hypothetical protein